MERNLEIDRLAASEARAPTASPYVSRAERGESERLGSARYGYTFRRVLLGADLIALALAGALMAAAADQGESTVEAVIVFAALMPIWVLLASGLGLYHLAERRIQHVFADEVAPVFMVCTTWAWLLALATALIDDGPIELLGPALAWAGAMVFVLAGRSIARTVSAGRQWHRQPIVLIGEDDEIERVLRRVRRHPEWGLDPVATISALDAQPVLGHLVDGRVTHTEPVGAGGNGRASVGLLAQTVDTLDVTPRGRHRRRPNPQRADRADPRPRGVRRGRRLRLRRAGDPLLHGGPQPPRGASRPLGPADEPRPRRRDGQAGRGPRRGRNRPPDHESRSGLRGARDQADLQWAGRCSDNRALGGRARSFRC